MPRNTLIQLYQYLAGPLDAKIGVKVNEINSWRHPNEPWHPGWEPLDYRSSFTITEKEELAHKQKLARARNQE